MNRGRIDVENVPQHLVRLALLSIASLIIVLLANALDGPLRTLAESPSPAVCERTPEVRDEIVKALDGQSCETINAEQLAMIPSLQIVASELSSTDLVGLGSLEELTIGRGELSELPTGIFDSLHNLNALNLSSNRLSALPSRLFANLGSLETLSLAYNRIAILSPDTFEGLEHLRTLNLNRNRLTGLAPSVFSDLIGLESLYLDNNQLSEEITYLSNHVGFVRGERGV